MNRKKIILIVSIIFLIVLSILIGGYIYLTSTKSDGTKKDTATGSLVPSQNLIVDSTTEGFVATSTPEKPPRLRQISKSPVSGYDFVTSAGGYVIWYVDRANGNILQASTSTLETIRLTNTTIPKVYESFISKNGTQIAFRTLDESTGNIQTFIGSPKTKTGTSSQDQTKEIIGSYIANNIKNVTISPSKLNLFGFLSGSNGGEGALFPFAGNSSVIFSHVIKNWVPDWVNTDTISLTTAPSARTQNISYLFSISKKSLTKIAGPRNGLVVSVSPSLNYFVLSENKNNLISFSLVNIKTQQEELVSRQTIADKCVWSSLQNTEVFCGFPKTIPNGVYPDAWYQGKALFDDIIGKIQAPSGSVTEVFDPQSFGVQLDITNPTLSPDEKYFLFQNKRDLTLWMYEL